MNEANNFCKIVMQILQPKIAEKSKCNCVLLLPFLRCERAYVIRKKPNVIN